MRSTRSSLADVAKLWGSGSALPTCVRSHHVYKVVTIAGTILSTAYLVSHCSVLASESRPKEIKKVFREEREHKLQIGDDFHANMTCITPSKVSCYTQD